MQNRRWVDGLAGLLRQRRIKNAKANQDVWAESESKITQLISEPAVGQTSSVHHSCVNHVLLGEKSDHSLICVLGEWQR